MKKPRKPPIINFLELTHLDLKLWKQVLQIEAEGKYRHWDILRHLTPPKGLTKETWWAAIKLHRMSLARSIPLKGIDQTPFSYSIPEKVTKQLHQIDLAVGQEVSIPEALANHHTRNRYLMRSLIEEAITSSQLEGAATTRKVAKEMLRSGRQPRDKNEKMILNNFLTMQKIREWKDLPLSKELIFEIHSLVTLDTLDKPCHVGRFRKTSDNVVIVDTATQEILHEPPCAKELDKRLQALCDFANSKTQMHFIHPIIKAILIHFWLAYDHPFVDGNGRTARALFYWFMLREGYWLFEYISISEIILKAPSQYEKAFLYTETDNNDLTYFILHQSLVIERSLKSLTAFIQKQASEEDRYLQWNPRQQALLSHAEAYPQTVYTIEEHRGSHAVAYDTARKDLLELYKRGLLTMHKRGKAFVFKKAKPQ